MWHQRSTTKIVFTFGVSPGICVRRDLQWNKGTRSTRTGAPRERNTEGQGGVYLMLRFPVL